MLGGIMKPILIATLVSAALVGVIPIAVQAQSADWNLTVNLYHTPFGTNQIYVEVKGPFGNNYYQWVQNGISPSTTFSLSGSEFPEGYNYQVCVGTGLLASILPTCNFFVHRSGDETVSWNVQ